MSEAFGATAAGVVGIISGSITSAVGLFADIMNCDYGATTVVTGAIIAIEGIAVVAGSLIKGVANMRHRGNFYGDGFIVGAAKASVLFGLAAAITAQCVSIPPRPRLAQGVVAQPYQR